LNSASIEISIQNKDINWNLVSLSLAALGGTVLSPDMDIANPSVSVQIANVGDDYSSYLSYDIVFYFAGQEMSRTKITKNKIEKNYQKLETSNNQIKAKDVPSIILSALNSGTTDWDVKIENIEYEKFG